MGPATPTIDGPNGRAWSFDSPTWATGGLVNLVEGAGFCVAGRSADIHPASSQGLYFLDIRMLSRFELSIDGHPVEPLATLVEDPFAAAHVGRRLPAPGTADVPLIVVHRRFVGRGMRDDVEVRNYAHRPTTCTIRLDAESDFADLFAVKNGTVGASRLRSVEVDPGEMRFHGAGEPDRCVCLRLDPAPDRLEPGVAEWEVRLPPNGTWTLCCETSLSIDGERIPLSHPCREPVEHSLPTERLSSWRRAAPRVTSDHGGLVEGVRHATEDLGALRIFDPDHPKRVVIAAGAPWFMTLFGRDSLLTSWMGLVVDPSLAEGVLDTLADLQGSGIDAASEEQPGRILHEVRFGAARSLSLGGGDVYYGTVDATPLFVMLLGELASWGLGDETIPRLRPNLERALEWIEDHGDLDGDGYVEYRRSSPGGLVHQGWKDSWDGVRFETGGIAEPPIALCEVQGYVYAALLAAARIARQSGDGPRADALVHRADLLKRAFNRDFWLPERGWYAMGLDRDKQPIDALASNVGHCLWTGIIDEGHAPEVARLLVSSRMLTGWGIRTLASTSAAYNPVSYHCGSVWPHDTALAAAGLMRYGFVDEAHAVTLALLDLVTAVGGRLPELIAGFSRDELAIPVPYPTSCSPQAWAAASPLLLLRTLLRIDPDVPRGKLFLDPALPPEIGRLHVEGIPVAGSRLTIEVDGSEVEVTGVPPGIEVVPRPRTERDVV